MEQGDLLVNRVVEWLADRGNGPCDASFNLSIRRNILQLTYNSAGHLATVEDRSCQQVHYTYTGEKLTTVTDVMGNDWTYTYESQGQIDSRTDPEGNQTKKRDYIYNAAERLTEVKENNQAIAKYQYDPFGRRIAKTTNNETTWYQYADEGLIAEYRDKIQIKTYGWEPQGTWGTNPLWQAETSGSQQTRYYFQNDHLGTSQRLTNGEGTTSWAMQAEAFGNAIPKASSTIVNNLRFPGQYFDEETQNYYNYFRDYNPVTGRYIESDPIALEGGLNFYSYVLNKPITFIDEKGQKGLNRPGFRGG